jgi:biopolymer transport protein ExbB
MSTFRRLFLAILLFGAFAAQTLPAAAQEKPVTLDELLERVRAGNRADEEEFTRREAEFRAAREERQRLLAAALAAKAAAERRSAEREARFEANEKQIPELEETLRNRLGTLGELFGVVRQVAGDTRGLIESSLVSAQLPGREKFLAALGKEKQLASIEQMERLWFLIQQEMTESGKVARFPATVVTLAGKESTESVVRVGTFNAVSGGRYLNYVSETGKLTELGRQPGGRHLSGVHALEAAEGGFVGFSLDPSRGSILALLIQEPNTRERIEQGGAIGYLTITLGIFGFVLASYRIVRLGRVGARVKAQIAEPKADAGNPLGRVLAAYEKNRTADVETIELKLDEAILRETPDIERGVSMIKVISVVAPLLGLLGTITGMIKTFQVMTLYGSGDPKLMAGGIAEALVTTMLGLLVAIPLTMLHSVVSTRSRSILQILEEQSVGLIAAHAEAGTNPLGGPRAAVG